MIKIRRRLFLNFGIHALYPFAKYFIYTKVNPISPKIKQSLIRLVQKQQIWIIQRNLPFLYNYY